MLFLMVALALPAYAVQSLGDDFVESWTTRDGLPHSTINGIGQTLDGYLWLATWEGIARYDGHEFRLYRRDDIPGLGDDSVRALHIGPHGDLWAGSARGGIVRWHDGRWDSRPPVDGLITDLLEEPAGRLWVATLRGGLVRIDTNGRRAVVDGEHGLPSDTVNALARDARGRIWVATSQGLARIDGDRAVPADITGLSAGPVFSLFPLADGGLLVGTEHGALVVANGVVGLLHPDLATRTATRIWRDPSGVTWVGTNNAGLARVDGDRIEWLDAPDGLPNNRVLALGRDDEGSLWVGTNGGLVRLRAAPIHTYTRQQGLADDFVRATLVTRDGQLWIGSGQGLDRMDPATGAITRIGLGTRLADASVLALAEDASGDVLVGTFHDGLLRLHGDAIVDAITMDDGLPSNEVRALLAAHDGRIWIGTKQGVVVHDDASQRVYGAHDGLPAEFVQALHEDADGAIWVGTSAGAAVIRNARASAVDLRPTDAQYVYGFVPSAGGDALWLATDRGLVRVARDGGPPRRVARAEGLPFEKIFAAVPDAQGRLWLTGNEGIARLRMAELEDVAAGRRARIDVHLFGRADGMASAQANGGSMPAATLDTAGKLWVATAIGVVRLDPDAAVRHPLPLPPVAIERFEVDGRERDPHTASALAPGDHRIVVRFVAPTLINAQRVHYRYRLDGLASSWIDLGTSREVQFTSLPPRAFHLRIEAWVPGEPEVSHGGLEFSITPYWWQRAEVWVVIVLFAIVLLGLAYGARVGQLRHTERRLRGLVDERTHALQVQTRIAERLARTDALTLLSNRRALDQALENQELEHLAQGHPVALMLVDVDGFKPINDLHGHAAGDIALQGVADVIRAHARQHDIAARWGGDEFALLLVDCTLEQALSVAERIRSAVEVIDCEPFAPGFNVTASVGVAWSRGRAHSASLRTLVPRADEALYRAKREGRNRVRAAVEPEPAA
ncbi:ligand-binding sensor domain-containing diguanylate cyclase [Cognatilysobacter terrigena]|uniref:ligand-binding sensor domain-containing diguanylate cyclase n=2 Tax=Cognatilysobacter terrigena TaxID=2488749 RepID=UPI001AADC162|nr:ligand-binding sensor domain-containing diguanylate cyclase [Lysobacter terrigena]